MSVDDHEGGGNLSEKGAAVKARVARERSILDKDPRAGEVGLAAAREAIRATESKPRDKYPPLRRVGVGSGRPSPGKHHRVRPVLRGEDKRRSKSGEPVSEPLYRSPGSISR